MLSSGKVRTSSWRYYTSSVACRATDYYLGVGEAPGRWTGEGLPALGLGPGSRGTAQPLEALSGRAAPPPPGATPGWRGEAAFAPCEAGSRGAVGGGVARPSRADDPARLERRVKATREFDVRAVEERGTTLERSCHRRTVELHQEVVG